jgi:DNA polymerase II small subunit/DNA polymerase delta subunit B
LTLDGFEVWAFKEYGDIHNYFDNSGDRYSEYKVVCTHIRKEIRQDQINGGMVGQYNPSITQRLNNLTEKSDITTNGKDISEIKVNIITSAKD